MKYQLLIFDWDGTLIDSAGRIVSSFRGAASELGFRVPDEASVKDIIGLGLPEAIARVMPELDPQQIDQMRDAYAQHFLHEDQTPTAFFDDVEQGLEALGSAGYRLAVATGKSRRGLDRMLDDSGFRPLFEVTRCADETRSKPEPQMLFEILEHTQLAPAQALMIGDTEYDLEMAHRTQMPSAAAHYGVHAPERLARWNPVFEMSRFRDLVDWLVEQA